MITIKQYSLILLRLPVTYSAICWENTLLLKPSVLAFVAKVNLLASYHWFLVKYLGHVILLHMIMELNL